MKRILSTLILLLGIQAYGQQPATADGNKVEIKTSAICDMCKHAIEYDLAFEKGVKSAELNLDTKVVTITFNPKKTSAEILRTRITKVGYHADEMKRDPVAYEKLPACCKDGAHADDHKDN